MSVFQKIVRTTYFKPVTNSIVGTWVGYFEHLERPSGRSNLRLSWIFNKPDSSAIVSVWCFKKCITNRFAHLINLESLTRKVRYWCQKGHTFEWRFFQCTLSFGIHSFSCIFDGSSLGGKTKKVREVRKYEFEITPHQFRGSNLLLRGLSAQRL